MTHISVLEWRCYSTTYWVWLTDNSWLQASAEVNYFSQGRFLSVGSSLQWSTTQKYKGLPPNSVQLSRAIFIPEIPMGSAETFIGNALVQLFHASNLPSFYSLPRMSIPRGLPHKCPSQVIPHILLPVESYLNVWGTGMVKMQF